MIGIVLLSADNYYVGLSDELPPRPHFDKALLLAVCKGMDVLCSANTEKGLPKSVKQVANTVNVPSTLKDVNLGIATFKSDPPDVLLLVRSRGLLYGGKLFDIPWLFTNYTCVSGNTTCVDAVSVWLKNPGQQLELDLGV